MPTIGIEPMIFSSHISLALRQETLKPTEVTEFTTSETLYH